MEVERTIIIVIKSSGSSCLLVSYVGLGVFVGLLCDGLGDFVGSLINF